MVAMMTGAPACLAARSAVASRVGLRARACVSVSSRATVKVFARQAAWAPGAEAPAHLDGSLPGDFGFDPLGLGKDPEKLKWNRQAELVHARFAMLATAGILGQELLSNIGIVPSKGVAWYDAGEFSYFANAGVLFVTQLFFMGYAENRRYNDILKPGSVNVDPLFSENKLPDGELGYPGGIFDPFDYSTGAEFKELQVKEIKNGRIAMMAMLGYYAQAAVVGGTPLSNWTTHIASPWDTTILTNMSDLFVWKWMDPTFLSNVAPVTTLPKL